MADLPQNETNEVVITDGLGVNEALVNVAGALSVDAALLELTQGSTTAGSRGPLVQGATTTAAPTYVTDTVNPLSLTTAGALRVDGSAVTQPISGNIAISNFSPSTIATYSAASGAFTIAAAATDIFTITGSATKVINILRIYVSATSSAGTIANLNLLKRSTANSAGTSAIVTTVPMDSTNAAGTAVVRIYTANPTLGTLVGNVRTTKFASSVVSPTNPSLLAYIEDFDLRGQSLVLRGTSQVFSVNFNGGTLAGNSFSIAIEWIEV